MRAASCSIRILLGVAALQLLTGCSEQGHAEAPQPAAPSAKAKSSAQPDSPNAGGPAQLGKPAPDFSLPDLDGKRHALGALKGKTVVLEWFNPECPFVRAAHTKGPLKDMAKRIQRADRVWLSINSGAPGHQGHGVDRNRQVKAEYGMVNPVLLDESGEVGHAYGALKTPTLYVIDKRGVLVYRGGIDNAPMGVVDDQRPRLPDAKPGQQLNYVEAALEDLGKGRAVRLPDTPAYGCSVKYGD